MSRSLFVVGLAVMATITLSARAEDLIALDKGHAQEGGTGKHEKNGHEEGKEHEKEHEKEEKEKEEKEKEEKEHEEPSDMFLCDFWAGWHEKWEERKSECHAVRIPLYRTRQPFLLREVRLDYIHADRLREGEGERVDANAVRAEVQAPLNRRLGVVLESTYEWLDPVDPARPNRSGPIWNAAGFLQLVDTQDSALNMQLRVEVPERRDLGEGRTVLSLALAGFLDLGDRLGLQAHIEGQAFLGPRERPEEPARPAGEGGEGAAVVRPGPQEPHSRLTYALALTKTWTEEEPLFSNFTTFLEAYAATDLDGGDAGRTNCLFVPGVRWELSKGVWVGGGVEIPVTGPRSSNAQYFATVIVDF